jgi:hypothetical protein
MFPDFRRIWGPLDNQSTEPLRIQSHVKHLDRAKREVVTLRYFDIPAGAVEQAAKQQGE